MVWSQLGSATGNALDFAPSNSFDWGSTFNSIGNTFRDANNFYNKNKNLFDFGISGLKTYSDYSLSNKAAKESKRMNDYYISQYDRQQELEDDARNSFQYGFSNSNAGTSS